MSRETTRLFKANISLLYLIITFVMLFFFDLNLLMRHVNFENQGVETEAVPSYCSPDKGETAELHFTYEVAGVRYNSDDIVDSEAICDSILESGSLSIRYLSTKPEEAEYEGVMSSNEMGWRIFLYLFLLGLLYWALKSRQSQLIEMGRAKASPSK